MIITVHVKPRAKTNSIEWIDEETAKVSVTAAAEKGKANESVIGIVANELGIAKSFVEIVRGATTRMKHLSVPDGTQTKKR